MDGWDFLDLATKAKELGITEGALRARVLSGTARCYIHAPSLRAYAEDDQWLPPRNKDKFPMLNWVDYGSAFRDPRDFQPVDDWPPNRVPGYCLHGWVMLDDYAAQRVLAGAEVEWEYLEVGAVNNEEKVICFMRLRREPKKEWITARNHEFEDGGYWRTFAPTVSPSDLFMRAGNAASRALSPRKEQSYLRIIAAMRELLQHEDGGNFPSQAKIIDQLVERYGAAEGVSLRNLEKVFALAGEISGDELKPKP